MKAVSTENLGVESVETESWMGKALGVYWEGVSRKQEPWKQEEE